MYGVGGGRTTPGTPHDGPIGVVGHPLVFKRFIIIIIII
jgi:hypothetical protein